MRKKTISFSILAFSIVAFLFSVNVSITHAATQPYQQLATYAIQLTKQATTSYGTYVLTNSNGSTGVTITLNSSKILATEQDFKNQVDAARANGFSTGSYSGFLNILASGNTTTKNTMNNTALDTTTRAAAMLSNDFYNNYILLRNNPKFNTGSMGTSVSNNCGNKTNNCVSNITSGELVFSALSWYQTLSEKKYYTWSSQNNQYRFSTVNNKSDIRKKSFKDIETLYNYLERQNRIIYIAPNGRKYGIFKQNHGLGFGIRFNRDNGSISENERKNLEDAKAYINQNNQPTS